MSGEMKNYNEMPVRQQRWLAGIIDRDIHEESPLVGLFAEVCDEASNFQKYMSKGTPSRSEEELLAFVCSRLNKRLLRGEIALEWNSGTKVSPAEAEVVLKDPKTWEDRAGDDYLKAVEIWSFDHRRPFGKWLAYWLVKLLKRQQ